MILVEAYDKVVQSWSLGSFLIHFFHGKIPDLMLVANAFDFRSLELIFSVLAVLL